MKELESLFEALYNRFILRDLFGKIVPGLILLVALYVALVRPDTSPAGVITLLTSLSVPMWIVLGSIGWITAFGVQWLGERIKILRYYGDWIPNDKSWYEKVVRFTQVASPAEKDLFERFVVIKETCGNTAMSLVLSALVLFIPWHNGDTIRLPVVILLGGVVLGFMHRKQVMRNTWWLESILEFRGTPDRGQPYQPPSNKTDKS